MPRPPYRPCKKCRVPVRTSAFGHWKDELGRARCEDGGQHKGEALTKKEVA